MPKNVPSVINTNNVSETKNTKQKWSRNEYREVIESYYTATFFPFRKSSTIENSDQHHITQPNGDVESQNTPCLHTHVNPEQISNNVQNGLSPEVLNIDPQSQPELDKINELKERVFTEWIKVRNVEISERNPLPKIRNTNKNQSTISKINIVLKIDEQKPNLTSLNHLIYASTVISTELCNVKIKAPKRNVHKKLA